MPELLQRLWELLVSFGTIGIFSLGGGNSMIKLIQESAVGHYHWMTAAQYNALVGATFLFPGLTAEKIVGMIGLRVAGIPGLVVAALGISLPGIILSAIFFSLMLAKRDIPFVKKLLAAMQWGAMALIGGALFDMMRPQFGTHAWMAVLLTLGLFVAMEFFDVGAIVGLLCFLFLYMVLPV